MSQTSKNNYDEKIKLSLTETEIQKLEKMKHLNGITGKRGALHYLLHERFTMEDVPYEKEFLLKVVDLFNKKISDDEFSVFVSEIAKNKKSEMILLFDNLFLQNTENTIRKSYGIAKSDKKRLDDIVSSLKNNKLSKRNITQSTVIRLLLQDFEIYQEMKDQECIDKLTAFNKKLEEMLNIFGRAKNDCLIDEIIKKYSAVSEEFAAHIACIEQLNEMSIYTTDFINKIQQKEGE